MKLADLDPRWLERDGQRVGLVFRCPHCHGDAEGWWLSCIFEPLPLGEQHRLHRALRAAEPQCGPVLTCSPTAPWTRTGDDFATLSITPSIDASAAGHWHGFVTAGDVA